MIISVNWLKKFVDIDLSIDELATRIGAQLVEIEAVEDLGAKYKDVIVARVVECAPLEGSDHLNLTKIDDGGVRENVERDENGLVQVVCGASNVRQGLLVAWLPPAAIVPETFGTDDEFVLGARALRGAMSNGMIASARELDLYDEHDGILEIDKDAQPGDSFAELYELNDYLLDIENKSLTHRPDGFGVIGFAREVAGILGKQFETPAWLSVLESDLSVNSGSEAPNVVIEDVNLSDRFQAIVLSGVDETAQSPIQLQSYLARSGMRPINAAVDVSNYLMLLTGQPSHTYDYDKLKTIAGDDFTIRVRSAREGEKLELLDGVTIELDPADVVIAAGDTAVGLAGIMGGKSTVVDATTKSVILEVATFDLYRMRSSQMRHGIFSEAVTRFTKGVPAPLSTPVLLEAARLLTQQAGATIVSGAIDHYPGKRAPIIVRVSVEHINNVLGTDFSADAIVSILTHVNFGVTFEGSEVIVTVPYWREDIHIPEDIVEEVGRLTGYDSINPVMPGRDFKAVLPSTFDEFRSAVRARLVRAGANEVLTYSFVHGDLLRKAGQDPDNAYRITNSISPDLQYYRQSLTPSLLSHIHANVRAGYESFALFEANKVHQKSLGLTDESVPVEHDAVAFVIADGKKQDAAYYEAKNYLEYLLSAFGLVVSYKALEGDDPVIKPFEPKRSALVIDAKSERELGVIGEYRGAVAKALKLPAFAAGFELDPRALHEAAQNVGLQYQPASRFPGTERDICFQVPNAVSYGDITKLVNDTMSASGLIYTVSPVDIYQAEGDDKKNVTVRITLGSYDKTLTADDVKIVIDNVVKVTTEATKGRVV